VSSPERSSATTPAVSSERSAPRHDSARIASVLGGIAEAIGRTVQANGGFDPKPRSEADAELRSQDALFPSGSPVLDAYSGAQMMLSSVLDQLSAVGALLTAPGAYPFAVATLTRSALENSCRAHWLLADGIDVRTRVGRSLAERLVSLQEQLKLDLPGEMKARLRRQLDDAVESARDSGYVPSTTQPVRLEGFSRIAATDVIRKFAGPEGELAYRYLSAIAHGTLYGLVSEFSRAPSPGREEPIILRVAVALYSFSQVTDRRFQLYGWSTEPWSAWRLQSSMLMAELMRRVNPN
jgi:hypothetical protein